MPHCISVDGHHNKTGNTWKHSAHNGSKHLTRHSVEFRKMHSKQTAMKKVPQQETEGALLLRIHEKGRKGGGALLHQGERSMFTIGVGHIACKLEQRKGT